MSLIRAGVRRSVGLLGSAVLFLACWAAASAQTEKPSEAASQAHPLALNQTHYRLRAGESTRIEAPRETVDFLLHAKARRVEIEGKEKHGIVIGPNVREDQVLLAASLTMKPGEYAVTVSAVSGAGEDRAAVVNVTLDPMQAVPSNTTVPPVVLLNGLQLPSTLTEWLTLDTCPVSSASDTFGSLETQLLASQSTSAGNPAYPGINGAGVPVVYFFDNCVEDPGGLIENLGNVLGDVLNLIEYDNGTLVPQVDLVSHSMGGLIVRAYLSGLQTNGALSPPLNPRVRKFIEIATPNFGSFLAANYSDLISNGTQTAEMVPGSTFLWYLATWNQRGDDLRGVDGLAIIGDAGYWQPNILSGMSSNMSDGVVSITSASLGFVPLSYARSPLQTRILPYCHTVSSFIDCSGGGIADVDQAPQTGAIILSFLENTSAWESIGTSNQTEYGGLYFALENAAGTQYTALESVSLGSLSLQVGANDAFFYEEFINGMGTFEATSTAGQGANCGSFSVPGGYYSAVRCKYSPSIYSVQSTLSTGLAGLTVASGSTITVNGAGFSDSTGTAILANGTSLSGQIVSDQEITAFLPSNYSGLVSLAVSNSNGEDAINIFVAPPALPPTISLSPTQLQFSYTLAGSVPASQMVNITNGGGGTLVWTASTNASWLAVTPSSGTAPATLSASVNPETLAVGTYTASVQITASGASGSPASVAVTLMVQSAQPVVNVTSVANGAGFQPAFASATWISIFGTNLSESMQTWQAGDFVNGLLPTSLGGVSVTINGLSAYVEYVSPTQLNALAPDDAMVGAVQVQVTTAQGKSNSFTAQKQQFSPAFFTLGGSYVAALHADYTVVGKPGLLAGVTTTQPAKPGEVILLYGTGFGPTSPPLPSGQLVTAPAVLANSVQVTIGGVAAPVAYAGLVGAGLYQINVTVPNVPDGDASISAQIGGVQTQSGVLITVQN